MVELECDLSLEHNLFMIVQRQLVISTRPRHLNSITHEVSGVVRESGLTLGLCTIFVQHTSASLVIQEYADPSVGRDLEAWMSDLAPAERQWEHDDEGLDDMPAHAKAAVTKTSEQIPFNEGGLCLGTWQGLYLWEHRNKPHRRHLVVHLAGQST